MTHVPVNHYVGLYIGGRLKDVVGPFPREVALKTKGYWLRTGTRSELKLRSAEVFTATSLDNAWRVAPPGSDEDHLKENPMHTPKCYVPPHVHKVHGYAMDKPPRRGRSNTIIDRNIRFFMGKGYSYAAAVKAAKTLAIRQENPMQINTKDVIIGAAALGAVGALLYAVSASAKGGSGPSLPPAAVTITPASGGQTYNVKIGDVVAVSLPAPNKGYMWNVAPQGASIMSNGSVTGQAGAMIQNADGSMYESFTVASTGSMQIALSQMDANGNPDPATEVLVTVTAS